MKRENIFRKSRKATVANKAPRMSKTAMKAKKICKAFEEEAEEILEDVEEAVKEFFPARKVKAALNKIENKLKTEGINARFDYKITRTQLNKTASIEVTEEELDEALNAIIDATVAEFEDLLKDTEEYVDETVAAEDDEEIKGEIESKIKNMGVACRFARRSKRFAKTRTATRSSRAKRPNPILSKIRG